MEMTGQVRGRGAATLSTTLKVEHRLHAIGMLTLPPVMTIYAIYDAAHHGLSGLDVALFFAGYSASAVGISVGFHRMLSHGAFKAGSVVRVVLSILGCIAGEGPPLYWAANHRRHHDFSDQPPDPHSPHVVDELPLHGLRGFLHAHAGWTVTHRLTNTMRYCPDLLRDPLLAWVGRHYFKWLGLGLVLPAVIAGIATQSVEGAWRGMLWGGFVRLFCLYHVTLAVNSIGHLYGRRAFDVSDQSRNVAWLAVPSFGEGWHNNHHAFPASAYFGLGWRQVDPGAWVISLLRWLRLVHDVREPTLEAIAAKKQRIAHAVRERRELQSP